MEKDKRRQEKEEKARKLLLEKQGASGCLPKKEDFDSETVCFIKQMLGPWPRALEAAGLKEKSGISSREKNREKHARRKERKKEEKRRKKI